jgi:hypothetical protein
MNRRRISFVLFAVVLGWTVSGAMMPKSWPASASRTAALASYQHSGPSSVSEGVRADTVEAGRVFIVQLPDSLSGLAIESYSSARLPLKSWLLEKSFFWATSIEDRGIRSFDFQAHPQPEEGEPEATLSEDALEWTLTVVVQ